MKKQVSLLLATAMLMSTLVACSTEETVDTASAETVTADVATDTANEAEAAYVFANMNIPYSDFYAAELTDNDVVVDTVTSATTSKWKMFEYTYFTEAEDGSGGGTIHGPIYAVKLTEELFDELSALSASDDYYVTALDAEPAMYKEVTVADDGSMRFSEAMGGTDTVVEAEYALSYPSNWGDFEIHLSGLPEGMSEIYAVEVVTDSGKTYGLRTLENIWSSGTQLSWGLGFKEVISKGNALSSEHYADMQGQTITALVYYVPEGTITVPMDQYVPYFFADTLFTVGEVSGKSAYLDATTLSTEVMYTEGVEIPADFDMVFTATNAKGEAVDTITLSDDLSTINWTEDTAVGSYTLEMTDANGHYMVYAASVVFQTDVIPVSFDASTLTFAGDSDDVVAAYTSSISSYSVTKDGDEEGTSYNVNTSHGTAGTPLLTADGAIDLAGVNADGEAVYESGASYTVTFTVTGYTAFTIAFTA